VLLVCDSQGRTEVIPIRTASRESRRLHALVLLTGLALVAVVVGGIAWAAIPQNGVYPGCFMKSGGTLRIIDAAQKCKSSETRIIWNQKGQPGQQGQKGEPGSGARGFFTSFEGPKTLEVSNTGSGVAPLMILTLDIPGASPLGPSFATATVQLASESDRPVSVICAVGEFGEAWVIDLPSRTGSVMTFTGGARSNGVPLGCHVYGEPAKTSEVKARWETIEAVVLSSLTDQTPQP